MTSSPYAIRVQNVSKHYGNFTAVDNLSFDVQRGEIFSMLGPNGAGKTTTIRMILDILKPDTGHIEVLGGPINDAAKNHIGYLPEERGLYRNVPVIDVLTYLGQLKGMSRSEAIQRATTLLEQVELGENIRSKVSELSKGMQQKVQILATVLHRPDLLIVDEPMSGLDPVNTEMIKSMLYQMKDEGATIVMSTHQMPQVEEMSDRLLMINHGKQVLYGAVDEVRSRFAKNAVIVEGDGNWQALRGVVAVEPGERAHEVVLNLDKGVTPDDLMQAVAASADYHVRRFELAVPSLNEIFIQVAGGGNNHNHRNGSRRNGDAAVNWNKIWLVARREYLTNFRRPSFLFTAFGVPLFSLIAMFVIVQLTSNRETSLKNFDRISYIDRAAGRAPVITVSDPDLNPDGYQPVLLPNAEIPAEPDVAYYDALQTEASHLLRDNQIDAFFVLPENYVLTGTIDLYSRKNPPAVLQGHIEDFLRDQLAAGANNLALDVPIERISTPLDLTIRDLDSGKELSEAELMGRLMVPMLFVLIYFMATSTTAQFFMSGVVEEKENRLMEILATSLKPVELLWGKLLGLGALSLTQIIVWGAGGGAIALFNSDAKAFFSGADFQVSDIGLMAVLFLLNFLLFAAIMMGIGASVTAEAESRQIAGFLSFIGVAPIVVLVTFFNNPNGPVPMAFTFFPLTTAVALILRVGLAAVPAWQIAFGVLLQAVSTVVVVWLAAKVFRMGMLMYGKMLTPRTLWAAMREGPVTLTTTPTELSSQPKKKKQRRLGWGR